jgi:hypothetical protein
MRVDDVADGIRPATGPAPCSTPMRSARRTVLNRCATITVL